MTHKPKVPGRMIRKSISSSRKIAALSPRGVGLFALLIPHYSAHGKMNGDPLYIKSEVAPLIPWLTIGAIKAGLIEIDLHTSVKWFLHEGRWFLHATNWENHQDIRADRLGADHLPDHPSVAMLEQSLSVLDIVQHDACETVGDDNDDRLPPIVRAIVESAADSKRGAVRHLINTLLEGKPTKAAARERLALSALVPEVHHDGLLDAILGATP